MTFSAMGSWLVAFTPFFFLCLMLPAFLAGNNDPAKTKRKVIELAIPVTMIFAWIICVNTLMNLSNEQSLCTRMTLVLWTMLVGAGIYGGASLVTVKSPLKIKPPFLKRGNRESISGSFLLMITPFLWGSALPIGQKAYETGGISSLMMSLLMVMFIAVPPTFWAYAIMEKKEVWLEKTKPLTALWFFSVGFLVTLCVSFRIWPGVIVSAEPFGLYVALMLFAYLRLRKQRHIVSVKMLARSSLTVGKVMLGISYLWMLTKLDDHSDLGSAVALGHLGSMYSLLTYCLLTLLEPLFQCIPSSKEEVHLNMVRFFWIHLLLVAAQVTLIFFVIN